MEGNLRFPRKLKCEAEVPEKRGRVAEKKRNSKEERRRKARTKIPQMVRVRPSEPLLDTFDEVLPTVNAARNSVYFVAQRDVYHTGMRLFVTFPYSTAPGAINQEFLGYVARIDQLAGGRRGVAVELLMPIYVGTKETIR